MSAEADSDSCGRLGQETHRCLRTAAATWTDSAQSFQPTHQWVSAADLSDLSGAFEDTSFASLAELVSENTLKGVKELGFEQMTEIQHKTIRPLLEGR